MVPLPVVVGLTVCRDVTVDRPSKDLTLVRVFDTLRVDSFPATVPPFCAFATLTGGGREGRLTLTIDELDHRLTAARPIAARVRFGDRVRLVRCVIRVGRCTFPAPGVYQLTLDLDGEWLAQTSIRVGLKEPGRDPST